MTHFEGPLLRGPVPLADDAPILEPDLLTARVARLRVLYLDEVPRMLEALPSRASLVIGARGDQPLLPTTVLAIGSRVGVATEDRVLAKTDGTRIRSLPVANLEALLVPSATAVFVASSEQSRILESGEEVLRQLNVFVSESEVEPESGRSEIRVSLLIEDTVPGSAPTNPEVVQRQLVVLDTAPPSDGTPLTMLFPSPFATEAGRGFAAFLTLEPFDPDLPGGAELVARWKDDLKSAAAVAFERATRPSLMETQSRALRAGVDAIDALQNPRGTLIFLSENLDSDLALDLALTAEDDQIQEWLGTLQEEFREFRDLPLEDAEPGTLGWALERTALTLIADRLDRDELSDALRGTLIRNVGEVGRSAPAIRGIVQRATTTEEMNAELVVENRAFLDSSEPASRVRAYDWLAARQLAPTEYDPLAPRAERRTALDADRERRRAAEMDVPGNPASEEGPR